MPKEYIEREPLMNRFEYYRSHNLPGGNVEKAYSIAKKEVAQAPSADVVEVVRCKECIHLGIDDTCGLFCTATYIMTGPEHFCSYGERKDGAE